MVIMPGSSGCVGVEGGVAPVGVNLSVAPRPGVDDDILSQYYINYIFI